MKLLHGNESLKRRQMRKQRQREIMNTIISMLIVVSLAVTFFQTMVWAQTTSPAKPEKIETNKSVVVDRVDPSYFRSHIEVVSKPEQIVETNSSEEVSGTSWIDPEDPYAALTEAEAELEAEAARQREEEEAQEAAAAAYKSSIVDQYSWVQYDDGGNQNDMTDDLVVYTYELCNDYNIDPSLVFGMIMVESRGYTNDRNSSSGAAGLGQFLASTARIVYEDFLGNGKGSYDHSVTPYEPYTGVTMMVTYLNYLYNRWGDTMTVLESYSGNRSYSGTLRYYNKVVSWAGKEID